MRALRWIAASFSCAALAASAGGCSADADPTASGSDDITNIPESRVKEQLIGNCWIYATLGWIESLHFAHAKEELNLSESYLTYLHWFTRITSDTFVFDKKGEFNTGDFFGYGEELVSRYGLMDEATFISSEANVDRSKRQEDALKAVEAALAPGGALGTPELRKDKAKVREVLDAAFALPPSVKAKLTRAFGADLSKTRGHGATLERGFRDPAAIVVARAKTGEAITLDDAMGELDPARPVTKTRDRGERRGKFAWVRVDFGKTKEERAASTLRLKKTLNAGFAVPIDWYPAYASMRADDTFDAPVNLARGGGWHSSLVHDYQVNVPGHGVLPAGQPVSDPAVLAKTLQPDAAIEFLRFKNSWGREVGPLAARGYTDATWAYLATDFDRTAIDYDEPKETGAAIDAFVLPPDTWEGATH
jgi:hypothetical protein